MDAYVVSRATTIHELVSKITYLSRVATLKNKPKLFWSTHVTVKISERAGGGRIAHARARVRDNVSVRRIECLRSVAGAHHWRGARA